MAMGVRAASMIDAERISAKSSLPPTEAKPSPYSGDTALRGGRLDKSEPLIKSPNDDLGKHSSDLRQLQTPKNVNDELDIDDATKIKVSQFKNYSAKAYEKIAKRFEASAEHVEQRIFDLKRAIVKPGESLQAVRKKYDDALKGGEASPEYQAFNDDQTFKDYRELDKNEKELPELRKQAAMFNKLAKARQTVKSWMLGHINEKGMLAFTVLNIVMMAVSIPSMFQQVGQMIPHHSSKRDDSSQDQQMPAPQPSIASQPPQQQWQPQPQQNPYQGASYPQASPYAQGPPPLQSAFMSGTQPPPPPGYGQNPYGMGG